MRKGPGEQADIFGNIPSYYGRQGGRVAGPGGAPPDQYNTLKETKVAGGHQARERQRELEDMDQEVRRYKEEEHLKQADAKGQKQRMMAELQKQMEDNKASKAAKKREEQEKDAKMAREYEAMMLEREQQRNAVQ